MIGNRSYKHTQKKLALAKRLDVESYCRQRIEHISPTELSFAIELIQRNIPFTFNEESIVFNSPEHTAYATYQASSYTADFIIQNNQGKRIIIEIKPYKQATMNFWYRNVDIALTAMGYEFYMVKQDRKKQWVMYNNPRRELFSQINRLV